MQNQIQPNRTVSAIMNFSLGLFLISYFINRFFNQTAGIAAYLGMIIAFLLIFMGFFNLIKSREKITFDKTLAYINLFIGLLFGLAAFVNWYNSKLPNYSLILMAIAASISLILGIILITSKKN